MVTPFLLKRARAISQSSSKSVRVVESTCTEDGSKGKAGGSTGKAGGSALIVTEAGSRVAVLSSGAPGS